MDESAQTIRLESRSTHGGPKTLDLKSRSGKQRRVNLIAINGRQSRSQANESSTRNPPFRLRLCRIEPMAHRRLPRPFSALEAF